MLWFAIAVATLSGAWLFYQWWIARVTLRWPVAVAKLDSGTVERSTRRYVVQLRYSYFVAGSHYGGTWFKYFRTEDEADRLLHSLQELMVLVRYDPKTPARSYFDPYRDIRIEKL